MSPVDLVKVFRSRLIRLPGRLPHDSVVTWGTGLQEMKGRIAQGSWVSQHGGRRKKEGHLEV